MQAVREDEEAAEASGVGTLRLKLLALVLSTALAGLAGGLFAYYHISYYPRSEEHTSELQSRLHLVCRLLLEKKKKKITYTVESNSKFFIFSLSVHNIIYTQDPHFTSCVIFTVQCLVLDHSLDIVHVEHHVAA